MEDEKMANEKFTVVGTNIQEKATVIWNIANALAGYFKPHEYGLVSAFIYCDSPIMSCDGFRRVPLSK